MKKTFGRKATKILATGAALSLMAAPAFAATAVGTDADDFSGFYDKVSAWLSGSLGKTIGIIGLGIGAVQVLRNAYASAAGFVLIGLLLSLGPAVIDSIMGAVI